MRTILKIIICFFSAWALYAQDLPPCPPVTPGATLLLTNSMGTGTFIRSLGHKQLTSTLTMTPFMNINNLYANKNLKISGEQKINFNWLQPQDAKASNSNIFVLSDFIGRITLKDAFLWGNMGLSLTPSIEVEAPVSQASRDSKRYLGLGTAWSFAWALNGFSLSYKPLVTGFINGSCAGCASGIRQTRIMLKNTVIAKYTNANHSIGATFRLYDAFLHPLASDAQASKLNESTLGIIEYSYAIPMRFPVALTLGVSSFQPSRNSQGIINFPFFDFLTPANNYSQIYFEMELALS